MSRYDMSSLKAGTFCAEPVSPAVQQFAMDNICSHYINSYWATEHGGIVFSCPWGDFKPLQACSGLKSPQGQEKTMPPCSVAQ